ncbi:DUF1772 domain-containing protein [Nocardia transvalensis]|uniref:DUF1772 domain-containing protein n=1 Tax=Nocardia transvalensis TaxID=37333 RepID=UPI001894E99F|nr:DUF1772 domain-containing protein [Nocardia transvalensis]MBF6329908.1 DUF1772 domain-containing protein [Nocardia transvalensis]
MRNLIKTLGTASVIANAAIYGTDFFCATVQRPAMARIDDRTLTATMGHIHRYGDERMPIPGAIGAVTSAVCAAAAIHDRNTVPAVSASISTAALLIWLGIYATISAPVNKKLKQAAAAGAVSPDARALQHKWDSVINARVALQGSALTGLCIAIIHA